MSKYHCVGVGSYLLCAVFAITLNVATVNCAVRTFPMSIYSEVYTRPKKSVFLSPLGIRSSLAAAGYVAAGNTKNEIFDLIDRKTNISFDYIGERNRTYKFQLDSLKLDKRIYLNEKMNLRNIKKVFTDEFAFMEVSFGTTNSTKLVNNFVKNETKHWVESIFPNSLNRQTVVAMINSLYFHSSWKKEFTSTVKRGFQKPMMHQYGDFLFGNLTDLNAMVLQMEFKRNDAKMLVLQPNDNDLQRLSDQLMNVDIIEIEKRLKRKYISLYFPIINEIKIKTSLKDPLQRMGSELAFHKKANFEQILKTTFIREMRHHTSFKCGRENARFVAVTGTQWDLPNSTKRCTCAEEVNVLEFENPDNIQDDVILEPMKKGAPHYYFEHKLFFALTHREDIVFVGTVAREK